MSQPIDMKAIIAGDGPTLKQTRGMRTIEPVLDQLLESRMSETPRRFGTFDNRYRYDHIYPRGRSGETLRAWDGDTPIVIKRPAPQDAPPMRAAQEVSIRTERKALERLSGHPVLTELYTTGTFRVGGKTHEYIAMERAEGGIVADMVLGLAEREERLPTLEMLIIVDQLLDLLVRAHDQQVVYNDVDAKHLFWNRDTYRLKVIDWGNAVLLDEGGAHSVTRQADIFQVGELLYFIMTGGKRLDSDTSPEGDHAVIFGLDAVHVPAALQTVITQATHPNLRRRYTTIAELRQQLREIRKPLEDSRNTLLDEVRDGLESSRNQQELAQLAERIDDALVTDPGHPETRQLREAVTAELRRLKMQSNIDAGRIYLDTANWSRASETMLDLLQDSDEATAPIIRFIAAAAEYLESYDRTEPPAALAPAIDELLRGDPQQAGVILATASDEDSQFIAERLTALVSEVVLLRPPLLRLQDDEQLDVAVVQTRLDRQPEMLLLQEFIGNYRGAAEQLAAMQTVAETDRLKDALSRAQNATTAILNYLETASRCVYSDSTRAKDALQAAYQIDPQNKAFDLIADYFDEVHLAIEALAAFKPKPNGADLEGWFERVVNLLKPYGEDVADQHLHTALGALQTASTLWIETLDALILGSRVIARDNLVGLAQHTQALSPHLATWANNMAQTVADTPYIEGLSPNAKLAQSLANGYKLWDQGKYKQVKELANRLSSDAEGEQQAIERLARLASIPAEWLDKGGAKDYTLTDRSERDIVALFLPGEANALENFTEQMPSETIYLKTMVRGLVDVMRQSSSAGLRILFLHYTWRGMLCMQENDLEGARFWREAALKTIADGRSYPTFAEFDTHLTACKLLQEAETALNAVQSPEDLMAARSLLNQPLADQWLGDVQRAVRHLEVGLRNWEDGDFRSARDEFDTALSRLESGEEHSGIDLTALRRWTKPLRDSAANLHTSRLKLEEIAHSTTVPAPGEVLEPNPVVEQVMVSIIESTEKLLGPDHAHQIQQWLSTYRTVRDTYIDTTLDRSEKQVTFQAHFAGLFIDRHPTYRLFRAWREVIQNLPDDFEMTSPTDESVIEGEVATEASEAFVDHAEILTDDDMPGFVGEERQGVYYEDEVGTQSANIPWMTLAAIGVVIIGVLAFALLGGFGSDDTPDEAENRAASAATVSTRASVSPTISREQPTNTLMPTTAEASDTPVLVATEPAASNTATTEPTATDPPTATETPMSSPTHTPAPTTAIPTAEPFEDDGFPQDVLRTMNNLPSGEWDWNPNWLKPAAGGLWQLGNSRTAVGDGPLVVQMSPAFLQASYGTEAAERLVVVEAEMQLSLGEDIPDMFFGFGLENDTGYRSAGEIRIPRPGHIGWGINENGNYTEETSFPTTDLVVEIRLVRNTNGTLTLFVDNQRLGESAARFGDGIPLTPVLYTSGGGVFVVVSRLQYQFQPIQ